MVTKDLKYYMGLSYTIELRRDEEGDWVASVRELERCVAHGATQSEALENLEDMKELWLKSLLKAGDEIPEPEKMEVSSSGKWLQRTPRTLHRKLAVLAKKEQVSLNQLVTYLLAEAVGARARRTESVIGAMEAYGAGRTLTTVAHQPYSYATGPVSFFGASKSAEMLFTRNSQEFVQTLSKDLSAPRTFSSKKDSAHGTTRKNLENVH